MLEEYADILTVEECCEALRVGYNAIYELLNSGKLRGYRNGRVWRIPKAALKDYIIENAEIRKAAGSPCGHLKSAIFTISTPADLPTLAYRQALIFCPLGQSAPSVTSTPVHPP